METDHHLQRFESEISKIFFHESIPFDRLHFKMSGGFTPVISDDGVQVGLKFHSSKEHRFPARVGLASLFFTHFLFHTRLNITKFKTLIKNSTNLSVLVSTDNTVNDDLFRIESGIEYFSFCPLTPRAWSFSYMMKKWEKIFTSNSSVGQSTSEFRILVDHLSLGYPFTLRDCGRALLDFFPDRDRFYIYF